MSEWMPIETAPRDGTSILLWDGEIHEAFWDAVDSDGYTDVMGWNWGRAEIDDSNFNPTHWMPLPEPPK